MHIYDAYILPNVLLCGQVNIPDNGMQIHSHSVNVERALYIRIGEVNEMNSIDQIVICTSFSQRQNSVPFVGCLLYG